jgi:predicted RecB family endonuclease
VSWKVTVRHGSQVKREKFDSLDEAIEEARARVDAVRREGGLPEISAFRDYGPDQRVHARIEISGPGLILGARSLDDAFARLREALDG